MPLDDIFYEENKAVYAKRLKRFWQKCAVFAILIVWLFLITNRFIKYGNIDIWEIIGTLLGLIVFPAQISFLLSIFTSYIPYRGFSQKEREGIYFYISIIIILLLYLLI